MGLLPEIDRAWITINHKLFLWDYVDGLHCDRYEEQPHLISYVGIVKPKAGAFLSHPPGYRPGGPTMLV